MKYLSSYVAAAQTEILNSTGAFFAFNKDQYEKGAIDGVKYRSLGQGLVCPADNTQTLADGLIAIHEKGRTQDLQENGRKGVIHRELGNYEAHITSDISDTVAALAPYGITEDEVQAEYGVFFQSCIDNDYF